MTTTPNLYDRDFYLWTQRQAELLRLGLLSDLDLENLAEEIESMGKRDRRQAIGESTLEDSTFPKTCPWTLDEVLDVEFWPD